VVLPNSGGGGFLLARLRLPHLPLLKVEHAPGDTHDHPCPLFLAGCAAAPATNCPTVSWSLPTPFASMVARPSRKVRALTFAPVWGRGYSVCWAAHALPQTMGKPEAVV